MKVSLTELLCCTVPFKSLKGHSSHLLLILKEAPEVKKLVTFIYWRVSCPRSEHLGHMAL